MDETKGWVIQKLEFGEWRLYKQYQDGCVAEIFHEEDAQHIFRVLNNHEQLLEACKKALQYIERSFPYSAKGELEEAITQAGK